MSIGRRVVGLVVASVAIFACGGSASEQTAAGGESALRINAHVGPTSCAPFETLSCQVDCQGGDDPDLPPGTHPHIVCTTTCSCSAPAVGPVDPSCGSTRYACTGTLPVPAELHGCSWGARIQQTGVEWGDFMVWACPIGTPVPAHIGASTGRHGSREFVWSYDGAMCAACGGDALPGYFFVVQEYETAASPGNCTGGCSHGLGGAGGGGPGG